MTLRDTILQDVCLGRASFFRPNHVSTGNWVWAARKSGLKKDRYGSWHVTRWTFIAIEQRVTEAKSKRAGLIPNPPRSSHVR